jgi:hypothetical protein
MLYMRRLRPPFYAGLRVLGNPDDIVEYARSVVIGQFDQWRVARVTIAPGSRRFEGALPGGSVRDVFWLGGQAFEIRIDHHLDETLEVQGGRPSKLAARLGRIAD